MPGTHGNRSAAVFAMAIIVIASGCSSDTSNPITSVFEPEIINDATAFQFQVTDARNVTTVVSYQWQNPQAAASIDHSTALTAGSAVLTLFDADSTQVYTSGLLASGTDVSDAGTAGTWIVTVAFSDFDGTANFRVEPFTP